MKTLPEKTAEQECKDFLVKELNINPLLPMWDGYISACQKYASLRSEQDRKEIERLKEQRDEAMRDNDRHRDKYDKLNFNMNEDWQKLTGRIKELESEIERLKDCELRACEVRDNRIKELEEALREWQARTSRQNYLFDLKCNTEVLLKQKALTKESAPSKEIKLTRKP